MEKSKRVSSPTDKSSLFPLEKGLAEKTTHILVIRLSALGDVAMTIPVLSVLTKRYPKVKITVLSKPFFKPLFAGIPNLNFYNAEVKGKHKGIPGLWKLAGELHGLQLDVVADLHHVLRSNILGFFFRWKGIRVFRINKGRKEKKALTRKTNKRFEPLKTTHQRYADVFERLGFPIDLSQYQFPAQKALTPEIAKIVGADAKKWIGIAPFAAHAGKTYPADLMKEVIAALDATNTFTILLFGGGKKEVKKLKKLAAAYENVITTAGIFSLEQELTLISNLDLMVAMDSGNAHLAALYGVKTITLWGVTHPFAGFYPFGQPMDHALLSDREEYPLIPTSVYGNTYPESYKDVMRSIPPEEVVKKIMEKIDRP